MSGETDRSVSAWTIDTLKAFNDLRFEMQAKFDTERDRRYTEVKNAEEKALKIKEEADKAALGLAREIQSYKDEKANDLRDQIGSERGLYALKTDIVALAEKFEATLKPINDYISGTRGKVQGIAPVWQFIGTVLTALVVAAFFALLKR